MELILKQDIEGLGFKDDVVTRGVFSPTKTCIFI